MAGHEVAARGAHGVSGGWDIFNHNNDNGGNVRPMTIKEKLAENSIHVKAAEAAAAQSAGAYMG